MVDAGIPILQGLEALEEQTTHPTFKKVLTNVKEDIQHGSSLSAAFANPSWLSRHDRPNSFFRSIVAFGLEELHRGCRHDGRYRVLVDKLRMGVAA